MYEIEWLRLVLREVQRRGVLLAAASALAIVAGCGGGGGGTTTTSPTITSVNASCLPTSITTAQTSTCTATVLGTGSYSSGASWTATGGTITTAGVFTPTTTGTATITATSTEDSTKSGSTSVTVNAPPGPTVALVVPSILLSGQQKQVTVTTFVRGANSSTQVQLFSLVGGTPTLIGNMTDDGQNGDKTAGDQVYTILATLTAPAASSLPMRIVASMGSSGSPSINFSVQIVQPASYATNTDLNQGEAQIYNTAIQTRSLFTNPNWANQTLLQSVSGNLVSMFSQFSGVVNQSPSLQAAAVRTGIHRNAANIHPENTLGGDSLTYGLLSPAQNGASCNQLVESLGGFSGSYPNALSPDDPNIQQFAQELTTICSTAPSCQGAFSQNDFLGDNVAAAEWAHEYIVSGQALPTPVAGCSGGVASSLAGVAVKAELSQFTDLANDGIAALANLGQIGSQAVGAVSNYILGLFQDSSSGNTQIAIGQVAPDETFAVPTAPPTYYSYTILWIYPDVTPNATIANTPVYPHSTTFVNPSPGVTTTVTPPYVTGFTPTSGPAGQAVSITGTGFSTVSGGNNMTFNGTPAQVSSSTPSTIQTTVPAGASSGPISVATNSGLTTSSLTFSVTGSTGNPVPVITSLFPNTATAGAISQLLTIRGTGFVLSSTVSINGISHPASFVGTNQLTITLMSSDLSTAGTYPVEVINPAPGGGTSGAMNFTVSATPPPGIGEWTWMAGSSTVPIGVPPIPGGQSGVYGTLGTPATGNIPGGRQYATSWTDSSGNFWLFGGEGTDVNGNWNALNDLWEFNPSTSKWTWRSGSNHGGQPGVYGTLGTPASGNVPGCRYGATSWTDSSGRLWLFGGGNNDLWEFNPSTSEWAWMSGSTHGGQPGVYGSLGTPAPGNVPGSRQYAVGWTDSSGHFWLFGGQGYDANGNSGYLNDLWEFNPSTNEWTWMGGSSTIVNNGGHPGIYGTLGTPAAGNVPGGRARATSWTDSSGHFWLLGGFGFDANGGFDPLNDLWKFDPSTNEWTWMGGSSTLGSDGRSGVYGTLGTPAAGNVPGGRQGAVGWTDSSGHLWLFGGQGIVANGNFGYLNELWEYNPSTNEWAWMSGSNTVVSNSGKPGVYGTLGIPAVGNVPGGRQIAVIWTDNSGHLWIFGGYGYDANDTLGDLNDLWRYQP